MLTLGDISNSSSPRLTGAQDTKNPVFRFVVDVNFFGVNLDFPKIKQLKKVCFDEPVLKCVNNATFKQIESLKLFIAF